MYLIYDGHYAGFVSEKSDPEYEKRGVNAALIAGILSINRFFINEGGYICDGERSILHETTFQNYLMKYFDFRKAYCNLNIRYRRFVGVIVKTVYPFRTILRKFDQFTMVNRLNAVLRMEEVIRRSAQK